MELITVMKNCLLLCKILIVVAISFLSGCAQVANLAIEGSLSEMSAFSAIGNITYQYPYVDFNRYFPETYSFNLSKDETWKKIKKSLKKNGEVTMEENLDKGYIFTEAKKTFLDTSQQEYEFKVFYYQYSIFLTAQGKDKTYVTCYPTVFEGMHKELFFSGTRNWLRGIFFGGVAAEVYPERKRASLVIATYLKKKQSKRIAEQQLALHVAGASADTQQGSETVHIMQSGETLGDIANQYTGNVMNYIKIAQYNKIKNINKIKVGQKIRIPAELLDLTGK